MVRRSPPIARSAQAQVEVLLWQFATAALLGARAFAIAIKRSLAPGHSKGFDIGSDDVGATHRYVVYPGSETFGLDRRTTAIPLGALVAGMIKSSDK